MAATLLRSHYPVVIVGAGPTGLTLANLLGVYGVECLVVERNAATVHEPRAVSIDDESLRTMQAAGLVETVMSETVAGYGSYYYSSSCRLRAKVLPTEQPYGFPRRIAFRQPVLERQLQDARARFPHVTAALRHDLAGFKQDDDGVTLRVTHDNGESEIRCVTPLSSCLKLASSCRNAAVTCGKRASASCNCRSSTGCRNALRRGKP